MASTPIRISSGLRRVVPRARLILAGLLRVPTHCLALLLGDVVVALGLLHGDLVGTIRILVRGVALRSSDVLTGLLPRIGDILDGLLRGVRAITSNESESRHSNQKHANTVHCLPPFRPADRSQVAEGQRKRRAN